MTMRARVSTLEVAGPFSMVSPGVLSTEDRVAARRPARRGLRHLEQESGSTVVEK